MVSGGSRLAGCPSYKVCQKETDSRMGTENMPQEGFSRDFYDNLILLIQIHYIVKEIPKK
jgi:hypothetical protein